MGRPCKASGLKHYGVLGGNRLGSLRHLPKKTAYSISSCQQKEPGRGVRPGTWKGPRLGEGCYICQRMLHLEFLIEKGLQRTLKAPHWRNSRPWELTADYSCASWQDSLPISNLGKIKAEKIYSW